MFTVSSTLMWAVLTGQADWVCHIGTLTTCIEVVTLSCIIVTWWSGPGGIQAISERPTGFLQCFDTVGLVIWPVKIIPDMTYNVFGGTLNLAQTMPWERVFAVSPLNKNARHLTGRVQVYTSARRKITDTKMSPLNTLQSKTSIWCPRTTNLTGVWQ